MAKLGHWDAAVVGGGIVGLAAAHACSVRGLSVVILERSVVAGGASGGPVGAMTPFAPDPWTDLKQFQFDALAGAERYWADIDAASGMDSGYRRCGRLVPLATEEAAERAVARGESAALNWGRGFSWEVRRDGGLLIAPERTRYGVVHDSLSARIDPAAACASLAEAARRSGTDVLAHHEVIRIETGRVLTRRGEARADSVIIAAGADSFDWLEPALRDGGVKGQAALLECDLGSVPVIQSGGIYIVPHANGKTGVGSTREREWRDMHATDSRLDKVIREAGGICPSLAGARVLRRWSGLRPRAPKGRLMLGPVPGRAKTFIATGTNGIGFGVAHAVGELIASCALGDETGIPDDFRTSFRPCR